MDMRDLAEIIADDGFCIHKYVTKPNQAGDRLIFTGENISAAEYYELLGYLRNRPAPISLYARRRWQNLKTAMDVEVSRVMADDPGTFNK